MLIEGVDKLQHDINEYGKVFEYNGKYYDTKGLIKETKNIWTQDPRTKKRILESIERWDELSKFQVRPHLCVEIFERYYILENSRVLSKLNLSEVKGDADIRLTTPVGRNAYYRASLVYWAFIDNTFKLGNTGDNTADECWVLDGNYSLPSISTVEKKDKKGGKRK
jgi:hypothetical protein